MLSKQTRIMAHGVAVALLTMGTSLAFAQETSGHPGPQPRPDPSVQTVSPDGMTTFVETSAPQFPEQDPFNDPPGSNFLGDAVYENMRDSAGREIPNSLTSTPDNPYNLHPDPVVTEIDKTSPTDDLRASFKSIREEAEEDGSKDGAAIQMAIDVLEGNPIPDRVYSGFPMLHYNGPEKTKAVEPIYDQAGNVIGGNLNVHTIFFDGHMFADVAFADVEAVKKVPWTVTYTVDTLNRGHEDFAPFGMYFDLDENDEKLGPHFGIDQTFFPMEDGTRTVFEIAQPPSKYWKLTYHWGWRKHPPRVQVIENANQSIVDPDSGVSRTLPEWEEFVFGENPTSSERAKRAAIAKIGDLSPAKRMWTALRRMNRLSSSSSQYLRQLAEAERAFDQWQNRNKMPDGVTADPDADWTLLYVNNTIYGQVPDIVDDTGIKVEKWFTRGAKVKVKLFNGDYYRHAYVNVDFGGNRGWENTFHSTIDVGGAGPLFTFGRVHWWVNAGSPLIVVPPAQGHGRNVTVGEHNVELTMNFEPSRRLRWYQFDPLHHDIAVWSVH